MKVDSFFDKKGGELYHCVFLIRNERYESKKIFSHDKFA